MSADDRLVPVMNALIVRCAHQSQHGGEGPIATLGRFPVLWICDTCEHVEVNP